MRPKKYKTKNEELLAKIYFNMKARCTNPKVNGYKYYGGKGICVCDSWLRDPLSFVKWGIESGFAPGLSIDRKDSDKGYFPGNCQWLTITANNSKRKAGPKKEKTIQVRMDKEDIALLKKDAEETGHTVSSLARNILLEFLKNTNQN